MRALSALTLLVGLSLPAQAAVDKGALLKGNQTVKGTNNLKGGGLISWNTYSSVDPTIFSHNLYSEKLTVLKSGHYCFGYSSDRVCSRTTRYPTRLT